MWPAEAKSLRMRQSLRDSRAVEIVPRKSTMQRHPAALRCEPRGALALYAGLRPAEGNAVMQRGACYGAVTTSNAQKKKDRVKINALLSKDDLTPEEINILKNFKTTDQNLIKEIHLKTKQQSRPRRAPTPLPEGDQQRVVNAVVSHAKPQLQRIDGALFYAHDKTPFLKSLKPAEGLSEPMRQQTLSFIEVVKKLLLGNFELNDDEVMLAAQMHYIIEMPEQSGEDFCFYFLQDYYLLWKKTVVCQHVDCWANSKLAAPLGNEKSTCSTELIQRLKQKQPTERIDDQCRDLVERLQRTRGTCDQVATSRINQWMVYGSLWELKPPNLTRLPMPDNVVMSTIDVGKFNAITGDDAPPQLKGLYTVEAPDGVVWWSDIYGIPYLDQEFVPIGNSKNLEFFLRKSTVWHVHIVLEKMEEAYHEQQHKTDAFLAQEVAQEERRAAEAAAKAAAAKAAAEKAAAEKAAAEEAAAEKAAAEKAAKAEEEHDRKTALQPPGATQHPVATSSSEGVVPDVGAFLAQEVAQEEHDRKTALQPPGATQHPGATSSSEGVVPDVGDGAAGSENDGSEAVDATMSASGGTTAPPRSSVVDDIHDAVMAQLSEFCIELAGVLFVTDSKELPPAPKNGTPYIIPYGSAFYSKDPGDIDAFLYASASDVEVVAKRIVGKVLSRPGMMTVKFGGLKLDLQLHKTVEQIQAVLNVHSMALEGMHTEHKRHMYALLKQEAVAFGVYSSQYKLFRGVGLALLAGESNEEKPTRDQAHRLMRKALMRLEGQKGATPQPYVTTLEIGDAASLAPNLAKGMMFTLDKIEPSGSINCNVSYEDHPFLGLWNKSFMPHLLDETGQTFPVQNFRWAVLPYRRADDKLGLHVWVPPELTSVLQHQLEEVSRFWRDEVAFEKKVRNKRTELRKLLGEHYEKFAAERPNVVSSASYDLRDVTADALRHVPKEKRQEILAGWKTLVSALTVPLTGRKVVDALSKLTAEATKKYPATAQLSPEQASEVAQSLRALADAVEATAKKADEAAKTAAAKQASEETVKQADPAAPKKEFYPRHPT